MKFIKYLFLAFTAYVKGLDAGGMKWVSGFPENVPRGIPTIVGVIVMNDMETGKQQQKTKKTCCALMFYLKRFNCISIVSLLLYFL